MSRAVVVNPGERYGLLTVLEYPIRLDGLIQALVRCDCGRVLHLRACHVARGRLISCGCQAGAGLQKRRKHGLHSRPEYMIWAKAKDRCCNPRNPRFSRYGGRGIQMSQEWMDSFEAFFADMGPRPSSKHSIERLDLNKGYEAGNCAWVSNAVQRRNTSRNVYITRDNKRYILSDLARAVGLKPNSVVSRRSKLNWPESRWFEPFTVEEAIATFEAQPEAQPT